ncbi:MAG: tetratricopeptide repeat protein [Deltaproteobacteria bacterium]|nr:tetratricopeptide repeat protein [Deltaproteobacteria bacterium]
MAYSPRSIAVSDDEVAPLLAQANELLSANDLDGARVVLERAISAQPKNQKLQSLLGMACFKLGHLDRAAELYELLVRENPVEPTLRVNLGLVYLKMANVPLAIREFQAGVDLAPEHKKAHNYLGLALAQAGEYVAAREAFIAAGSVAMVEKMDRSIAEHGRSHPHHAPEPPPARPTTSANGRNGFHEIETDAEAELEVAAPQRPVTTPAGAVVARPATQDPRGRVMLHGQLAVTELVASVRIDAVPQSPFDVRGEVAAIRVAGEVLTRLEPLVALSGSVGVVPEMKRFRGRATDKPFGRGVRRFARASGEGLILVATEGKHFLPLELGEAAAYFVEEAVFAFEEALTFENGRLPGKSAPDLHLVHLRGHGKVLLAMNGPLRSIAVSPVGPTLVSVDQLVGWLGSLTPKLIAPLPEDGEPAKLAVELTGEGFALLSLAEQTPPHGRPG